MNWVQQNYDRFLLALFAALLLACAGLLFYNAQNFAAVFASIQGQVPQNTKIPPVHQEAVTEDLQKLNAPDNWQARIVNKRRLPVFDSVPYIAKTTVGPDGTLHQELIDPLDEASDRQLHPPVPNGWLLDNNQDLLSPDVLTQDSDGDGFSTLDEYLGHTNPQDKNSHPPYYTKLFLGKIVNIPFRLRFDAKNGDTIQINLIDVADAPTWFGKVGGIINLTKPPYKVVKFVPKSEQDHGILRDVSEVTVENTETHEQIVLPKQKEVNSPTSYAVLDYKWTGKQFAVKKNQEFTLRPEDSVKYKALELNDTSVTILKEDENKQISIKPVAAIK